MPTECAFTLPTGQKCRCMATRNHCFCRHHGAPRQKAASAALRERWSRISCWRELGRSLADIPKEEIPDEIHQILASLLTDRISDRVAGRFLRLLLQRCGEVPTIPGVDLEPAAASSTDPIAAPASQAPAPASAAPAAGGPPALTPQQTLQALDELSKLNDDELTAFLGRVMAKAQVTPKRPPMINSQP